MRYLFFLFSLLLFELGWCQQNALRDSVLSSVDHVEYNNAFNWYEVDLVFRKNTANLKSSYLTYLDSAAEQMNFYKGCDYRISLDRYNEQPDVLNQARLDWVTGELDKRVDTSIINYKIYWQREDPNAFDAIFGPDDGYYDYVQQTVTISMSCQNSFHIISDSLPYTGYYADDKISYLTFAQYKNGEKNGSYYEWDRLGQLIVHKHYAAGKDQGLYSVTNDSLLTPYIGKEISYFPGGEIRDISWYKYTPYYPTEAHRRLREIPPGKDTVLYSAKALYTDYYRYSPGEEPYIERYSGGKYFSLHGQEHNIGAHMSKTITRQRIGDTASVILTLKNFGDSSAVLTIPQQTGAVLPETDSFKLAPYETWQKRIYLVIRDRANLDSVLIVGDSVRIKFEIETFGYHLSTSDLIDGHEIMLPTKFTYCRLGPEALFKVYDKRRKPPIATIILYNNETFVDLSNLAPGKYWIVKFDYQELEWIKCRLVLTESMQ